MDFKIPFVSHGDWLMGLVDKIFSGIVASMDSLIPSTRESYASLGSLMSNSPRFIFKIAFQFSKGFLIDYFGLNFVYLV